MGDKESSQ